MSNRSEQALNAIEPWLADLSYNDKSIVLGLIFETLDEWERRRELGCLIEGYYICLEGTRLIIDGEASGLYLVDKSQFVRCEYCHEEFVPLGQEVCEHCDDTSIPCPACGTVPPDDYCADCDIIVSHDKCDECEEAGS